jgi:hypothetical protein
MAIVAGQFCPVCGIHEICAGKRHNWTLNGTMTAWLYRPIPIYRCDFCGEVYEGSNGQPVAIWNASLTERGR